MSKRDRYAHLGDGTDVETTAGRPADADSDAGDRDPGVRVRIDDGDETVTLTVDPDAASVEELREAVLSAADAPPTPFAAGLRSALAAQRLAIRASTAGTVLAIEGARGAPFVRSRR